jgi:hypothetical protein
MKIKKLVFPIMLSLLFCILGFAYTVTGNFDLTITVGEVEGNQNKNRVAPGSYVRLDTYLTNNGPDAAPGRILVTGEVLPECPYLVGWYLSVDENITTDDIQVGGFCPNGLEAGQTLHFWADVYIPVNIEEGFYYWGAIVDYNNSVTETDETNNAALGTLTVVR